jgi:N-acetylneuraminate epimerase
MPNDIMRACSGLSHFCLKFQIANLQFPSFCHPFFCLLWVSLRFDIFAPVFLPLRSLCLNTSKASFLVCFFIMMSDALAQSNTLNWLQLPSLPDPIGFAGPFVGTSGGALIVAGGANFPNAMPWDGGQKVWYDSIFVLSNPDARWLTGFKLPRPLAYGVSVSTPNGILCTGGSDAHRHYRDVFLLSWLNGKIQTRTFPPLPRPMANGCGALVGSTFYLAGGTENPDATNALHTFWSMDINEQNPAWKELDPWPGPPRMLAVAGASDGAFFLFSGVELSGDTAGKPVRHYLKDAYRFTPRDGWKRIANLPRAAVAAPSPAVSHNTQLLIVSGDDGALVNFEPKSKHPGFPKDILAYDVSADEWTRLTNSQISRATAPVVEWNGLAVIANGESKPGYRTPEVWGLKLQ